MSRLDDWPDIEGSFDEVLEQAARRVPNQDASSFNAFVVEVLNNPEAKAAYEDHRDRNWVVDLLRTRRFSGGLSCREVSRRMGVSDATVRRLELEGSDPTVSLVQRYARAVGYRLTLNLEEAEEENN